MRPRTALLFVLYKVNVPTYKMTFVAPTKVAVGVMRIEVGYAGTCTWQVCDRPPLRLSFHRAVAEDPGTGLAFVTGSEPYFVKP